MMTGRPSWVEGAAVYRCTTSIHRRPTDCEDYHLLGAAGKEAGGREDMDGGQTGEGLAKQAEGPQPYSRGPTRLLRT